MQFKAYVQMVRDVILERGVKTRIAHLSTPAPAVTTIAIRVPDGTIVERGKHYIFDVGEDFALLSVSEPPTP